MHIRLMSLCVVFLVLISPLFAQEMQTFVSADGSFSFEYPVGWSASTTDVIANSEFSVVNIPGKDAFDLPEGFELQILGPFNSDLIEAKTPHELVLKNIQQTQNLFSGEDILVPSTEDTLQPLGMLPIQIIDLSVEGRSLAYGYFIIHDPYRGINEGRLIMAADLGNHKWVLMSADSMQGGLKTIQVNESSLLNIIRTMRYTPVTPPYSGNPDLPRVYSGPLPGLWRGSIEFYYPENWFISRDLVLSNKEGLTELPLPDPGQVIVRVNGPSETRLTVNPLEIFNECNIHNKTITARSLVGQIMDLVFPEHLEELTKAGISVTQPEIVTFNGVELVYYRTYETDLEYLTIYVDLGEGNVPLMSAVAVRGEMVFFEDQLFQMASTLRYTRIIPQHCFWPPQATSTP